MYYIIIYFIISTHIILGQHIFRPDLRPLNRVYSNVYNLSPLKPNDNYLLLCPNDHHNDVLSSFFYK